MSIISEITGTWSEIMTSLIDLINDAQPLFYSPTDGLTFMGTLAVVGLAVSVCFLGLGIVQRFIHLRG